MASQQAVCSRHSAQSCQSMATTCLFLCKSTTLNTAPEGCLDDFGFTNASDVVHHFAQNKALHFFCGKFNSSTLSSRMLPCNMACDAAEQTTRQKQHVVAWRGVAWRGNPKSFLCVVRESLEQKPTTKRSLHCACRGKQCHLFSNCTLGVVEAVMCFIYIKHEVTVQQC